MHEFLSVLTRRTATVWMRYGLVFAVLGIITLFRLVVPLDAAPFLLYLPVVFLISVALGQGPGHLGTILSAALAASFFVRSDHSWWQLEPKQHVAIIEYLLVSTAMVQVCGALRKMIVDTEQALERLQASETNLKTIVDTVPVGIMFAEAPSGRIVGRNKRMAGIAGEPGAQAKTLGDYGKWISFHADGTRVEGRDYPLAKVINEGVSEASLEVQYQRRDGSRLWIDLIAAAVRDPSGTITGAVVAVSDIDARKTADAAQARLLEELSRQKAEADAAKEAAEAANRAKSAFLANMSHELRTPLSAVIGYTELLEEEAEERDETVSLADLGKIKSNAKHLLGLINDVLDLSKVEANKMEIVAERIDVEAFTRDAAATVASLVGVKSNTLALELAADLGTIHSDPVKLRQCLFNLLANASKFTERGRIVLRVDRQRSPGGEWVRFAVEDTGIGMTREQVGRLFQRFSQADESTTRRFGGTGLGLALSRAFAQLLGGDIAVESVQGQGSCFTLRVPVVAPVDAIAEDDRSTRESEAGRPARDLVLVIDDEASQRDLLLRFLQRQNFAVRTASDGRSGLALARTLKPRVILLDVMMPGMDGWTVLKALKSDAGTVDIPVVMVSFVAEPGLSAAMGAAGTIAKPIDWMRLKAVLEPFRDVGGDVLVVDDDADTRQRLRMVLEKNGWTVQEAGDGVEALARVKNAAPRVILLDLTMPIMDGFAFLHRLRATPGCSRIPVVVLSARDISAADRERLADADRVLRKGETSMRDLAAELRAIDRGDGRTTRARLDATTAGPDEAP